MAAQESSRPCVFCDIAAGRVPASVVYRDDRVCAFMDIRPVNPGHLLVIPLAHAAGLTSLESDTGAQMFRVGQRLAEAIRRSGVRCEGINFLLADGEAAGQEVFHVHLHVIPRYAGDGFGFRYGPDFGVLPDRAVLEAAARAVREALPGVDV
jgi:diadenosine tetraphosphate (Ap4A) HIT family hydrolase